MPIGLSSDCRAVCHCIHIDGDAAAAAAAVSAVAADDYAAISLSSSCLYDSDNIEASDWLIVVGGKAEMFTFFMAR